MGPLKKVFLFIQCQINQVREGGPRIFYTKFRRFLELLYMELFARFEGALKYSKEDEYLQGKFKSAIASCAELYGDKDIVVNARIGRNFLRKHASLLSEEGVQC